MGTGQQLFAGNIFTVDGQAPHFPSASDHFPDKQTNVVPINESMGAYNAFQQSDVHSYWEFKLSRDELDSPALYELPFTGGFPDNFQASSRRLPRRRRSGKLQSIVPGPRDQAVRRTNHRWSVTTRTFRAIRTSLTVTSMRSREFRERGVPSGLANENLSRCVRTAGFLRTAGPKIFSNGLFDAYAAEIRRRFLGLTRVSSRPLKAISTPPTDGFPKQ